eukprot:scaffold16715_cov80-Cyclotella_meneghiniana.AAC.5
MAGVPLGMAMVLEHRARKRGSVSWVMAESTLATSSATRGSARSRGKSPHGEFAGTSRLGEMARKFLKVSGERRRMSGVKGGEKQVGEPVGGGDEAQADEAGAIEAGGSRGREHFVVASDACSSGSFAVGVVHVQHRDEVEDSRAFGDGDGVLEDGGGSSGCHCVQKVSVEVSICVCMLIMKKNMIDLTLFLFLSALDESAKGCFGRRRCGVEVMCLLPRREPQCVTIEAAGSSITVC